MMVGCLRSTRLSTLESDRFRKYLRAWHALALLFNTSAARKASSGYDFAGFAAAYSGSLWEMIL